MSDLDKTIAAAFYLTKGNTETLANTDDLMNLVNTKSLDELIKMSRIFRNTIKCDNGEHEECQLIAKYPDGEQYPCNCYCHEMRVPV